ncbi:MAG: galactose oxidase early set domain-containing protein [Bacteroidota bacterium]
MLNARVWVSGTTYPEPLSNYDRSIEIYSPGYLFEGTRPTIIKAPDNVLYGSQFSIQTDIPIAHIRLIRLGVTTHATDMDQRSVGLAFTSGPLNGAYPWDVTAPADEDIAPPGWYMLFVLRAKSDSSSGETMIPSVAWIVKLART